MSNSFEIPRNSLKLQPIIEGEENKPTNRSGMSSTTLSPDTSLKTDQVALEIIYSNSETDECKNSLENPEDRIKLNFPCERKIEEKFLKIIEKSNEEIDKYEKSYPTELSQKFLYKNMFEIQLKIIRKSNEEIAEFEESFCKELSQKFSEKVLFIDQIEGEMRQLSLSL